MTLTVSSSAVIPFPASDQPAPMSAPVRDREEAHRFLRLLDPKARSFTFQTFEDKRPATKGELARVIHSPAWATLLEMHACGAGVYVSVNATDGKGRKSENIKRIRAVWQEDDKGHGGPFPLDPSLVIESSPNHFHRYWLVDNWPADEQGRADFANVMERMVASYGSDKNAKDISRVLRLPGFLHRKDPALPHLVSLVEDSGRRYARRDHAGIPASRARSTPDEERVA
jgi:hypothetical protein